MYGYQPLASVHSNILQTLACDWLFKCCLTISAICLILNSHYLPMQKKFKIYKKKLWKHPKAPIEQSALNMCTTNQLINASTCPFSGLSTTICMKRSNRQYGQQNMHRVLLSTDSIADCTARIVIGLSCLLSTSLCQRGLIGCMYQDTLIG